MESRKFDGGVASELLQCVTRFNATIHDRDWGELYARRLIAIDHAQVERYVRVWLDQMLEGSLDRREPAGTVTPHYFLTVEAFYVA